MRTEPLFACRACSHEWTADNAVKGCPECGEHNARWLNYVEMFGEAALAKPQFQGCSGELFRQPKT